MKLPWDRSYLKISFHVIFTLVVIYALALLISNASEVVRDVENLIAYLISVFTPLIVAVVFSYIVNPAVERLQGFYISVSKKVGSGHSSKRTAGTILLYLFLFSGIALVLVLALSGIGDTDIGLIVERIRSSVYGFTSTIKLLNVKLAEMGIIESETGIIDSISAFIKAEIESVTKYFAGRAGAIGSFFVDLVIGLVAAFYFLVEKEKILRAGTAAIKTFMPKKSARILKSLSEANSIFSGYISAQITDAFVMASLISLSLLIIGIDYPLIIGIISGFSNLIPYVGAIVAFILAIGVALIGGSPIKALYAAIAVILLQQLDSIVIVPKIVGNKVKLHPVMVILSLSVFGGLFGIGGMVLAVPAAALIKSLLKRIYDEQRIRNAKKP